MKYVIVGLFAANVIFAGFNFYTLERLKTEASHSELVAQQFRVVDEDSNTRLVLSAESNEATITALDNKGTIRYQFSINDDGSYTMLFDSNEEPRVGYFVKDQDNQVVHFSDRVDDYAP